MRLAAKHLIGLGHQRIAHLSGPLYADTGLKRLQGYRKALMDAGITYRPEYVLETQYDEKSGYETCRQLLGLKEQPTAICAGNDMVAKMCIRDSYYICRGCLRSNYAKFEAPRLFI